MMGAAGFDNVNMDLIFALPDQTLAEWESDLQEVIGLKPTHLSLYQLTLEPGTEFGRRLAVGELQEADEDARGAALKVLAEKWPDETTRKLLAERTEQDHVAASHLGGMHSEFGRIVFTKDVDGYDPYLDPAKPISRDHIKRAAKKAGISADAIDETVRSLSEHMGWDITKGPAR